jgi:glycosyltransferase involved in cell wall biosynthesis
MAREAGRPLVAKVHGSDVNVLARGWRARAVAAALNGCQRVICVSQALRERLVELGVSADRLAVIPNGVDDTRFAPRERTACRTALGLPPGGKVVLFVGNLVPVKGVEQLLAAMRGVDAGLVVVGDGPLRAELEALARSLGVDGRVRFAGARPHDEVPQWLGACDLLCLPSWHEGCPNVVLEALACGRPVVGTRTGGVGEHVRDGENGFLVPPGDGAALSAALGRALASDWPADRIRQTVSRRTWAATADDLAEVVRRAVNGCQTPLT